MASYMVLCLQTMLILIIKIILTPFAMIASVCNAFVALMLWDKRGMDDTDRLYKIIWTKKGKDINEA